MSLATRCTSCGTVFRVVQDQLKVSEGWVRCGRCNSVFNALEGLFDLGRDSPERRASGVDTTAASPMDVEADDDVGFKPTAMPPLEPDPEPDRGRFEASSRSMPAAIAATAARSGDEPPSHEALGGPQASAGDLLDDPIDAKLFRKRRIDGDRHLDARDRNEFSDARFDSDLFEAESADEDPALIESASSGVGDLPLESASMQLDFLRRAERRSRWRGRPLWLWIAVVGAILLMLQAARHGRDTLAAHAPALRPMLEAGCRWTGCSLEPPRRIDAVSVESTGLNRAGDAYALTIALRNRVPHDVLLPWVDLSVSDVGGRVLSRKVLAPRDFGAAPALGASRETTLQATLQPIGSGAPARIAGYTVEIFYP